MLAYIFSYLLKQYQSFFFQIFYGNILRVSYNQGFSKLAISSSSGDFIYQEEVTTKGGERVIT